MLKAARIPTPVPGGAADRPVAVPPSARSHRSHPLRTLRLLAGLMAVAARTRRGSTADTRALAVRARACCEQLGGLWIKVGQLLSLRTDVFSPVVCQELGRLQDRAAGFPPAEARAIVETELGVPVHRVFARFDDTPIAAGSIGQVHRGRLRREDVEVVVKVRRPAIERAMLRDLRWVRRAVNLVDRLGVWRHLRWPELITELEGIVREELDYRYEAAAARRLRASLRAHSIYVPKSFRRYSTQRVLVQEHVAGAPMSDVVALIRRDPETAHAWMTSNGIRPRRLARRLFTSLLRQIFEDNAFHGDLHPGNVLLLRGGGVALIDFGACGSTDPEYLDCFRSFVLALGQGRHRRAARLAFSLCVALPPGDLAVPREQLARAFARWTTRTTIEELPYTEKSVNNAADEATLILVRHRCAVGWGLLRIRRVLATLDASLADFAPDANYSALTRRYFEEARIRRTGAIIRATLPGLLRAGLAVRSALNDRDEPRGPRPVVRRVRVRGDGVEGPPALSPVQNAPAAPAGRGH